MLRCKGFPLEPARAGNDPVVGVRYSKWAGAVAVVRCVSFFCDGCRFLGEADQDRGVELRVEGGDVVVRVHGIECIPQNVDC